jgi:hypothetical protein
MLAEHLRGPKSGCEHSGEEDGAFQQWRQRCESHVLGSHAQLSAHEMKSTSISISVQTGGRTMNSDRYIATIIKLKAKISSQARE